MLPLLNPLNDPLGDRVGLSPERTLFEACGHWSVHKSGFDGQHMHTAVKQPISQTLQEDAERSLGRAIDVV